MLLQKWSKALWRIMRNVLLLARTHGRCGQIFLLQSEERLSGKLVLHFGRSWNRWASWFLWKWVRLFLILFSWNVYIILIMIHRQDLTWGYWWGPGICGYLWLCSWFIKNVRRKSDSFWKTKSCPLGDVESPWYHWNHNCFQFPCSCLWME